MTRFTAFPRRALLTALGAAGLTRFSPAAAQRGEPVLRVVAPWEYTSGEPTDTGYIHTRMGIAETLIGVEPDGRLVGQIAESWAADPDQLTWRFRIRPGMQFHDGSAVTAAAVAASLQRAFKGESLSNLPLAGLATEGDAVVIRTRTPFGSLPAFLLDYAAIILAPAAYGQDGKVQSIIATGPYKIAAVDGRTTLELTRFDGYWGRKPAIARARYTAVPNGETRANTAIAGDADLVFTLAPQAAARIDAGGQARFVSSTIPRLRIITLNLGLRQFADVRVRQAISLCIDRAGIAAGILRHPASAATQLLPSVLSDWANPDLPPLRTDPAAARALLSYAIALPVGILAGLRPRGWVDRTTMTLAVGLASLPAFLIGIGLVSVFALSLHWLPAAGARTGAHMVLPSLTLALTLAAFSVRILRNAVIEVLGALYMTFARIRGLGARAALRRHGVRNAAIPVVTFAALQLAYVVDGFVVVETLFAYPGLGDLLVKALLARDVPVIMGVGLLMASLYALCNLVADLLCLWLDPRRRAGLQA